MRQPLDLRQTEPNSCQSLVAKNVLYTLGCKPPSLRQIDKELDRKPGQLPRKSPIPIWLQHKLRVTHFSTFDADKFIAGGAEYLEAHHGNRWDSDKPLRDYWTLQRVAEHQEYLRTYQKQVKASGSRYRLVPREPSLNDVNRALKQEAVCHLSLTSHATMVYGRNDEGNYLIYYPEESYSLDKVPDQYINFLWQPKRSLTIIHR